MTANGNVNLDTAGCEGEFWVTLMQRGLLKFHGVDYTNPTASANADFGSGPGNGSTLFEGFRRLGTLGLSWFRSSPNATTGIDAPLINLMRQSLAAGKAITVGFNGGSTKLVDGGHAYEVIRVENDGSVLVRNPWGVDGGTTRTGADDGYVLLTAREFSRLVLDVAITNSAV